MDLRARIMQALRNIIARRNTGGAGSRFVYMRILAEMRRSGPVERIEEMREMKYVGDVAYGRIVESMGEADRRGGARASRRAPDGPAPPGSPPAHRYIPSYNSVPYAILKILHSRDCVHRHYLSAKIPSHSASALKLLARKGLVGEEERRLYLTEAGQEVCRAIGFRAETEADDRIYMVIDSREKESNRNVAYFQSYFHDVPLLTRHLGVGDFVWIRGERVFDVVVERKSGADFISSVADGRYREQRARMRMIFRRCFYILEGVRASEEVGGWIVESKLEEGFTVVESRSVRETGEVIRMIDGEVRREAERFSEELMGYGSFIEESAKAVDVRGFLLGGLLGIRGVSREKAVGISEHYGSVGELLERTGDEAGLGALGRLRVGGRAVGRRLAAEIVRMLG